MTLQKICNNFIQKGNGLNIESKGMRWRHFHNTSCPNITSDPSFFVLWVIHGVAPAWSSREVLIQRRPPRIAHKFEGKRKMGEGRDNSDDNSDDW